MNRDELLNQWVSLYGKRLYRIAFMHLKNACSAEDRVQDAFIKAYFAMDQLKNLNNPFPWLVRILINECNSFQKRGWREILSAVLPERSIDSVEDTYLNLEQNNRIYEAILSLPTIYRIPIVLFYFEDMSIEQIANTLDNNANSIKTRLFRGRERLRKLLKEDDTYGKSNQSCETAL